MACSQTDPTMSGALQFSHQAGCMIVTTSGRYLVEEMESAILAIAAAGKARQIRAILLDLRGLERPYGFMDRYKLGELVGLNLAAWPIAVLVDADQVDRGRIGLTVAKNRGAQAEMFVSEAGAYAWLRQYQVPDAPDLAK